MPRTMTYAWALALCCGILAGPVTAQNQVISIALVNFQDDSGSNASPELTHRLAQELQRSLLTAYKDVLPRMISSDAAGQKLSVEQLAALGKESGASFVIRGGLLSASPEPVAGKNGIKVQLYGEVISVDRGAIAATLRAEGSGAQEDPVEALSAVDVSSAKYPDSAVGVAIAAAVSQLADSVHQAVIAPSTAADASATVPGNDAVADATAAPSADAVTAEADEQLQQLLTEAESILSAGGNASTASINAVRQSLDALRSALSEKASRMESGQDSTQADQNIETNKQTLQAAIAQVNSELTASATSTSAETNPTAQQQGLLASIDQSATEALSILQKIQEMRAALKAADEPAAQQGVNSSAPPAEQPVSEGTGVVVDENGHPVEGAQVTDQTSGTTTTTDSNGIYRLQGLLSNRIATLVVQKGPTKTTAQTEIWRDRPAVLDFRLKTSSTAKPSVGAVMPSTVFLRATNNRGAASGTLAGVVRDAQGRPVGRALVNLKGLGVARTNSQGQYTFLNVPAGAHELIISEPGLRPRAAQVQVVAKQRNDTTTQFTANDALKSVRTPLVVAGSATVVKGIVVDHNNRPVAGARVSAVQDRGAVSVATGPQGTFELRNLKPGPYHIVVSKAGYESMGQDVALRSGGSEARNFQLKKTSDRAPVVVNRGILPQPAVNPPRTTAQTVTRVTPPRPGAMTAQVFDSKARRPLSGATISITGQRSASSDSAGRVLITNLSPGIYQVTATKPAYSSEQRTIVVKSGETATVMFGLTPRIAIRR